MLQYVLYSFVFIYCCVLLFLPCYQGTASASLLSTRGTISVLFGSHLQLHLSGTAVLSLVYLFKRWFSEQYGASSPLSFRLYLISTSEAQSRFESTRSSSYRFIVPSWFRSLFRGYLATISFSLLRFCPLHPLQNSLYLRTETLSSLYTAN